MDWLKVTVIIIVIVYETLETWGFTFTETIKAY